MSLLQNLSDHVQEHKAVTYKWFAREYSLPANYAKQLLFRFVKEQGSKIRAVYMVSGISKADDASGQHIMRLVPGSDLEACCNTLQEGTISVHIHRWGICSVVDKALSMLCSSHTSTLKRVRVLLDAVCCRHCRTALWSLLRCMQKMLSRPGTSTR